MKNSLSLPSGTLCLRLGSRTLLLHRRAWLITLGLLVALTLLSLLALTLGSGKITMMGVIQTLLGEGSRLDQVTVFKIRLPRLLAVLVAGAAMGLSGCLVQTLVRNRLATPDMIGVNEGASLAIIIFSLYLTLGTWPWWAAPFGALFAAAVLYALCNKPGEQGYLFVVIGIGVSELMNALGQFVMSTQSLVHLTSLYLWNMGNFVGQGYGTLLPVSLLLLLICPWTVCLSRSLGVLRLGPVTARTLGVNVNRVQLGVLAQAIIVAALGTAIGGASWLSRDRIVPLWIAALCGALMLLASDTLVRVLASPHEVATGIMTRILGGLLLLFILLKDRQKAD
ncbi:permease [Aeromonas caviae]|uniref:iron ABC transporter permease n=1 Tax=Aeromonas caviae TaxID=648 RepID=UPI00084DA115|nr:iron ABC transporter permease [Aeromonas caviae]OEG00995.1 permease [Aeromonas caviae]